MTFSRYLSSMILDFMQLIIYHLLRILYGAIITINQLFLCDDDCLPSHSTAD